MSIWSRSSKPRWVMPREQLAAAEITDSYTDLLSESRELAADVAYAQAQAKQTRARAAQVEAKVSFEWTTVTVAYALFGALAAAAVFTLDTWMFTGLGWPLPAALLFGTLVSSLYASFGLLAKAQWGTGTTVGRLKGAAVLAVLAAVAAWLVPLLAAARADELLGPDLDRAKTTATTAALYAKNDPAEAASAQFATQAVTRLEQQRDTVANVAAGALVGALLVEVAFAGYTAAVPLAWRANSLHKRAQRFDTDAADTVTDAGNAVTETQAAINATGTRLGLDVDTTTRIAIQRWEELRRFTDVIAPARADEGRSASSAQPRGALPSDTGTGTASIPASSEPTPALSTRPTPRRTEATIAHAPGGADLPQIGQEARWDGIWA